LKQHCPAPWKAIRNPLPSLIRCSHHREILAAIGETPDASASHSVSAKRSAGEKTPEGPHKRQIAGEKGRSNLPQADLTAGNGGRISSPQLSEESVYGWLAVGAVRSEPFSTANSLLTGKLTGNIDDSGLH
jgi:hypothetical protein